MHPADLKIDQPSPEEVISQLQRFPQPAPALLEEMVQRLRQVEEPTCGEDSAAWPAFLRHAHSKHDARFAEPARSHRPLVGPPLVWAKRSFRALFQPLINEVLRKQVEFNEAILDALARIHELQQESLRSETLWRARVEAQLEELRAARLSGPRTSTDARG